MSIFNALSTIQGHYKNDGQHDRAQGLQYAIDEIEKNGVPVWLVRRDRRGWTPEIFMFLTEDAAKLRFTAIKRAMCERADAMPEKYEYYDGTVSLEHSGDPVDSVTLTNTKVRA